MAISNTVTPRTYTRSPGAYKGIAINPGTDKDIAGQIAKINSSQSSPVATPTTPVSSGNSAPAPKVKGLVQPKSFATRVEDVADAAKPNSTQRNLVGALTDVSRPTSTQTGLIKDLRNTAQGNFAIGKKAGEISDMYGGQIARVGGLGAAAQAGYNSSGTNIVGAGNAAIASQSASQRMTALAAGQQAALQGTAQQLTGQSQAASTQNAGLVGANTQQANQISGTGTALNAANAQQTNTITGLSNAAGYAQPIQAGMGMSVINPQTGVPITGVPTNIPYGQAIFNPATGQIIGGGGANLDPQTTANDLAQKVINKQMTYDQAVSSLSYAGGAGQQFLNNALRTLDPNFNIPLTTASISGQSAGVQAVNAAPGTTQADQYSQIAAYKSSMQQGQQLASQLDDLIKSFNLNPSNLNVANAAIQKIAANTSDPKYQILSNYLSDVASRYSQVLTPPGGNATDMTRSIAASMINATASGKSIRDVLNSLDQQAQAVINAVPASGTVPGASGNYKEGDTRTSGGYSFIYSNGKWIPR